jgi:hypothetical protein
MCDESEWPSIDEWIRDCFPNLRTGGYEETSERTCLYNCIAWAAGDTEKWWWPSEDAYWPEGLSHDESTDNFKLAFRQERNYEPCADGSIEAGYEKVAIYAIAGKTKHMARQLESGAWTSKLGMGWDISHQTLEGVETNRYGKAVEYMKRPRVTSGVEHEQKTTSREGCAGLIFRAFRDSS